MLAINVILAVPYQMWIFVRAYGFVSKFFRHSAEDFGEAIVDFQGAVDYIARTNDFRVPDCSTEDGEVDDDAGGAPGGLSCIHMFCGDVAQLDHVCWHGNCSLDAGEHDVSQDLDKHALASLCFELFETAELNKGRGPVDVLSPGV